MEKKSGIYMWTSPSGKSYIGQSVDLTMRKRIFCTFNHTYGGNKINCARKKYSHKSLWNYKVLEYCGVDKLDERERYYIELYDTINNGYNCESGGHENKIISDEVKRKLSEAMKGKRCGEKHPLYGKHLTEEQKRKMSKAKKGENNPMYGKHLTDEHKRKISKAHDNVKIAVSQYTIEGVFIASYESIHEAQRLTNIDKKTISRCCRGIQKTAGGFKWAFKNPPLLKKNEGLIKN